MSQTKKLNFNLGKNKIFNFLRNGLRIIFLFVFLHWILWFTTYPKGTSYFEAIKDEKVTRHDEKTDKYNSKGLLGGEHQKKYIAEIEEDVLTQIEKKKGLEKNDRNRFWKKEKLPDLEKLDGEIKELEKKPNANQREKEELETKKEKYKKELKIAKEKTIENIQNQLKENDLNITELDDNRNWWQRLTHDPLKFFLISPLNEISKSLELSIILEMIFKLLIVETLLILMCYPETIIVSENMDKMRDESLSIEEIERLNEESAPLVKYWFFNGFMTLLFSFFVFYHPAYFDQTNFWFQTGKSWIMWFYWILPLFVSTLLSIISTEFLRHSHLPNKQELKSYLVKNLVISLVITLINLSLMKGLGMNSTGRYLFLTLIGLTKFSINTIRGKVFGHREYSLGGTRKTIN